MNVELRQTPPKTYEPSWSAYWAARAAELTAALEDLPGVRNARVVYDLHFGGSSTMTMTKLTEFEDLRKGNG